jgi:protein arginine kinase
MDPRLEPILHCTPAWLTPDGPEQDVVVSSRIRLARNLAQTPFPTQLPVARAQEICEQAETQLTDQFHNGLALDPAKLEKVEADFLVERSLASRDLFENALPSRVMFLGDGSLGLMVNEEDHFRAQGFARGLDLVQAFQKCSSLTGHIEQHFPLATHQRYGYLTCCPSNVGSGMRASLMLHLPGLSRLRTPLQHTLHTAQRASLAVRGVHGEGSLAMGSYYQISNQRTLGLSTSDQLQQIADFGRQVSRYERETREQINKTVDLRQALIEDAQAAWQLFGQAPRISTTEALNGLNDLRLLLLCGLGPELATELMPTAQDALSLSFQIQPGHLQARFGLALDVERRDISRAQLLRRGLKISDG